MSKHDGNKLSLAEYSTRKLIDVAAALAVPVAAGLAYVYGQDIAHGIKHKLDQIKMKRH